MILYGLNQPLMMGAVAVVISRMQEKNLARQIAAVASESGGLGIEWSWYGQLKSNA